MPTKRTWAPRPGAAWCGQLCLRGRNARGVPTLHAVLHTATFCSCRCPPPPGGRVAYTATRSRTRASQSARAPKPRVNSGFSERVQPSLSRALLRASAAAQHRASRCRTGAHILPHPPPEAEPWQALPPVSRRRPRGGPLRVGLPLPRAVAAPPSVPPSHSGRGAAPDGRELRTHRARGELRRVVVHVRHRDDGRGRVRQAVVEVPFHVCGLDNDCVLLHFLEGQGREGTGISLGFGPSFPSTRTLPVAGPCRVGRCPQGPWPLSAPELPGERSPLLAVGPPRGPERRSRFREARIIGAGAAGRTGG